MRQWQNLYNTLYHLLRNQEWDKWKIDMEQNSLDATGVISLITFPEGSNIEV